MAKGKSEPGEARAIFNGSKSLAHNLDDLALRWKIRREELAALIENVMWPLQKKIEYLESENAKRLKALTAPDRLASKKNSAKGFLHENSELLSLNARQLHEMYPEISEGTWLTALYESKAGRERRRCGYCGKLMPSKTRPNKKYCSNSCRTQAFQAKKAIDVADARNNNSLR